MREQGSLKGEGTHRGNLFVHNSEQNLPILNLFAYVNLSKIWQLEGTHRGNLFAYVNLSNLFLVFIQATLVSVQAPKRLCNNLF